MTKEQFNDKWTPEPFSGCWLWLLSVNERGYGQAYANSKKPQKAHRCSWEIHNGAIPKGLYVLHRCDTPACVNPAHLFLGTLKDNIQDSIRKGRFRFPPHLPGSHPIYRQQGEKHWNHRLSAAQVLEIRNKSGTLRALAKQYGVNFHTIDDIKKRRKWAHI